MAERIPVERARITRLPAPGATLTPRAIRQRSCVLAAFVVLVVVANLVVSVMVPGLRYELVTEPAWQREFQECEEREGPNRCVSPIPAEMIWDSLVDEYFLDLYGTLFGIYLWGPALELVLLRLHVDWPWQPTVWITAVGTGSLVAYYARGMTRPRLIFFALLAALMVSGFGTYYWSTLGD